jgi:hypothetical protein
MKFVNDIKMMKQSILTLLFMMASLFSVYASEPTLSDEEKQEFSIRIKQKIEDFQTHLGIISSKESNKNTVNAAVNECLKLFIGKGGNYSMYDPYGNEIEHAPVTIQVTSKSRGVRTNTVKRYLTTLANNLNKMYTKVNITSSDAVRVDNMHETGDGRYECVAYFFQKFEGYRDGRLVYTDITTKKVRVYLEQIEGPVGKTWSIALGDISAVETR